MLKGYINKGQFDEAERFFKKIKTRTSLAGIAITYNCALDAYARQEKVNEALELFQEIQ